MASITAFIRVSAKKADKANIRFRIRDGRNIQLFYKSELEIDPNNWDVKAQAIKTRVIFKDREAFNKSVTDRKEIVLTAYNSESVKLSMTSEILDSKVDQILHPEEFIPIEEMPQTFFEFVFSTSSMLSFEAPMKKE